MFKVTIKVLVESFISGVPVDASEKEVEVDVSVASVIIYGGTDAKVNIECRYQGSVIRLMEATFKVDATVNVADATTNSVLTHSEFLSITKD